MKKNDKNRAFLMRDEYEAALRIMDPSEGMDMIFKMYDYFKRDIYPEDLTPHQEIFWAIAQQHMDEDGRKYDATVERNRINGAKGGAPKGNTNASKTTKTTQTTQWVEKQPKQANKRKEKEIKEKEISLNYPSKDNSKIDSNNKTGIELSPPGDRLSSKPSDKPSEEELAELFGNFMNRQRNRLSSQDREAHLQSIGFYDMTADEKIAYLEEERRRKRANS